MRDTACVLKGQPDFQLYPNHVLPLSLLPHHARLGRAVIEYSSCLRTRNVLCMLLLKQSPCVDHSSACRCRNHHSSHLQPMWNRSLIAVANSISCSWLVLLLSI